MIPRPSVLLAVCLMTQTPALTQAQAGYQPSPQNLAAREWFQNAKFGLFIHWGIYSVLASGEWVMQNRGIPAEHYERLAEQFNPTQFDAREWVALAKAAGMRYITITSKHHDGFAMYDSALTDWDIVDRTPYGRDVLADLAQACRAEGVKLFFYHSQLDSGLLPTRPDRPRGRTA